MRATQRITWLLLTTSFLLHSIFASEDSQNSTSVSKDNANVTAAMAVTTTPVGAAQGGPTVTAKTDAPATTGTTKPPQTPSDPVTKATTPDITVTMAKPTDKPTTTLPPATTAPNNQPAARTTISGAPTNNPTTTKPSPSQTPIPAATTDSSSSGGGGGGGPAASTRAPEILTTKPSAQTVVPSVTTAPVTQPGGQGNVGTASTTKVPTSGQPPSGQTTIGSGTTPQDGKGGKEPTTVTVTNPPPTASRAPQLSGTTLSPSIPATTGPPTGGTSGAKVGTTMAAIITTVGQPKTFLYSLNAGQEKDEEKELVEVCRRLMVNLQEGNCTLTWRHHGGKVRFDCVEINGKVKTDLAKQIYEEISKKPTDNKTLIAILASCGALLIMIVILAVCASHHRKPYNENQQHLTEELHTVENGYHDNPTLEVMEVQPEMQEKKMVLNGEFNNDSWIVPIDNLKEDLPDEEDTHL